MFPSKNNSPCFTPFHYHPAPLELAFKGSMGGARWCEWARLGKLRGASGEFLGRSQTQPTFETYGYLHDPQRNFWHTTANQSHSIRSTETGLI